MQETVRQLWPEIGWIHDSQLREQVTQTCVRAWIEEVKAEVERICGGKPRRPQRTDKPVAIVKWVDGTVIDTIWQVP